jgi:hypothetical protein
VDFLSELSIVKSFMALSTSGKIIVIGLHILGLGIIILLAPLTDKAASKTRLLVKRVFITWKDYSQNIIHRSNSANERQCYPKPARIRWSKATNSVKKDSINHDTKNSRDEHLPSSIHGENTVSKVRSTVNHNREEP